MAPVRHDIAERDVGAPIGDSSAGTEGAVTIVYGDAVLVELSAMPAEEPLDHRGAWPIDRLETVWRAREAREQDMEA